MISRQPMNATFYMGQQGFFECLPSNNSFLKPSVTWYRNGIPLNTNIRPLKYFVSPNTNTLLLSQVDANDIGDYHCVLTNPVDSVNSSHSYLNVSSMNSSADDIHHSGDSISGKCVHCVSIVFGCIYVCAFNNYVSTNLLCTFTLRPGI